MTAEVYLEILTSRSYVGMRAQSRHRLEPGRSTGAPPCPGEASGQQVSRKDAPDDIPLAQDEDMARTTQPLHQPFRVPPHPFGSTSLQPFDYPAPRFLESSNDACTLVIHRAIGQSYVTVRQRHDEPTPKRPRQPPRDGHSRSSVRHAPGRDSGLRPPSTL